MKEYITREISPNNYEYGYKIQLLDLKLMDKLEIDMPEELKKAFLDNQQADESKYLYFNSPEVFDFLGSQYYIREYLEYASMNSFEVNLLINYLKKELKENKEQIKITKNKEMLKALKTNILILENDIKSFKYLKANLIKEESKRK